jgi:hypothetical protein
MPANDPETFVTRLSKRRFLASLIAYPGGQGIQDIRRETTVKDVMYQVQPEYAEAIERARARFSAPLDQPVRP